MTCKCTCSDCDVYCGACKFRCRYRGERVFAWLRRLFR